MVITILFVLIVAYVLVSFYIGVVEASSSEKHEFLSRVFFPSMLIINFFKNKSETPTFRKR